jgi:hypothetical protein
MVRLHHSDLIGTCFMLHLTRCERRIGIHHWCLRTGKRRGPHGDLDELLPAKSLPPSAETDSFACSAAKAPFQAKMKIVACHDRNDRPRINRQAAQPGCLVAMRSRSKTSMPCVFSGATFVAVRRSDALPTRSRRSLVTRH